MGKLMGPFEDGPPQNAPSKTQIAVSSPGKTAQQNAISTSGLTTDLSDLIPSMWQYQSAKAFNPKLRFQLALPNGAYFQAHLDPNDFSIQKQKRFAQLDTLDGIVIQDFGYKPTILEIKGTTGSRYWDEINQLDVIFKGQSAGKPMPVTLSIEGMNYTGFWSQFSCNRTINSQAGNLVQYSMQFIVFSESTWDTSQGSDTIASGASVVANNKLQQAATFANSKGQTTTVVWTGRTINQYINSIPALLIYKDNALGFIEQHWNDIPSNGAYPGPTKALTDSQRIVVPNPWSNFIASQGVTVG